jgi:hypothetical protein
MLKNRALWASITVVFASGLLAGCGERAPSVPPSDVAHLHKDVPPHGGKAVALGEDYKMELVLDAPAGKLDAYVFDDEFENFVRIATESFEVTARLPGREEVLTFKAVSSTATGETVGDTSMFETRADWLKTQSPFDGVLKQVTVRGNIFSNVVFNFPNGNATNEKKN